MKRRSTFSPFPIHQVPGYFARHLRKYLCYVLVPTYLLFHKKKGFLPSALAMKPKNSSTGILLQPIHLLLSFTLTLSSFDRHCSADR